MRRPRDAWKDTIDDREPADGAALALTIVIGVTPHWFAIHVLCWLEGI